MVSRRRIAGCLAVCLAAAAGRAGGQSPVISEIQAQPLESFPEFIEILNPWPQALCLGSWRLRVTLPGAAPEDESIVHHVFPATARVEAFSYVVLTVDSERFRAAYGFAPHGQYVGFLPNAAARVALVDGEGFTAAAASYDLAGSPLAAGGGASLELRSAAMDGLDSSSWAPSRVLGGTPGAENSTGVSWDLEPVVPQLGTWRYFKGTGAPPGAPAAWTLPEYDDSAWLSGEAPLGYGNAGDGTVLDDMRSKYSTVYLRRAFSFKKSRDVIDSLLWVVFDDGFVAYINGTEVLRRNLGDAGAVVPHDAVATARQEAEGIPEEHRLADISRWLVEGKNVLAVQAANDHVRSSDFQIHAALTLAVSRRADPEVPELFINEAWREGEKALVELFNPGPEAASLDGFQLLGLSGSEATALAPGPAVPGRGFRSVEVPAAFLGTTLCLVVPGKDWLVDAICFPSPLPGVSSGRFPDGDAHVALLPRATPAAPNEAPAPGSVVINEIHYSPLQPEGEFVELLALESSSLDGWALEGAALFSFPAGTSLSAGEHLVVARSPNVMTGQAPWARVLGPFRGRLANDAEKILLLDADGRTVDCVRYADDGAWPPEADGSGASLELADPFLENDSGSAWRASLVEGGTPGKENSAAAGPRAPVIVWARHEPLVPRAGEAATISARVDPPSANVDLLYNLDGERQRTRVPMGLSGGIHSASLPGFPSGSTLEFSIEATGGTVSAWGEVRTLEGTSRYPAGFPGTCLLQVDDRRDSTLTESYRIILRQGDLDALRADVNSNEERAATFLGGGKAFYGATIRYRGHGSRLVEPKSYRVRFTDDEPFQGQTVILLNGFRPERQVMGMDLWRRSGMPYSRARIVQLVLNGVFYPRYARMEPIEEDYLQRHFSDAAGNLYRGLRTADLGYLGEDPAAYAPLYEKHTNQDAADWSDVVQLTKTFSEAGDEDFPAAISKLIDVDEWIRYFAINGILSNQEGGLHRDTGDDYFMFHVAGGKFVLLPWDMDSTYLEPLERIYRPSLPSIRRLIAHPHFAPRYWRALDEVLSRHFKPELAAAQATLLEPAFSADVVEDLVTFVRERSAFLRRSIPAALTAGIEKDGWGRGAELWSSVESTRLRGTAPAGATFRVTVNGREAAYEPWRAEWSFDALLEGEATRFRVAALDELGEPVARRDVVVRRMGPGHVVSALGPGRTEWTLEGSPYAVTGDLEVGKGSELLIRPGARVLVPNDATIKVAGTLRALGEASRRIAFDAGGPGGGWAGLRFQEGAEGVLEFCDFATEPGSLEPPAEPEPLIVAENSTIRLDSCTFQDIPGGAVRVVEGKAEIVSCSFLSTGEAIHGVLSTVVAKGNLVESIRGDCDAIDLDGDPQGAVEASRLEENTILGGGDDGIDLLDSSAVVSGNIISGCADRGISVEGPGSPGIVRNVVSGCFHGIALKDGTEATGHHDTVTGCRIGLSAFVKKAGSPPPRGEFHSTIVWGNDLDITVGPDCALTLDHSNVGSEPGAWGEANIFGDPMFSGVDDWRLRAASPCVGAGRGGSVAGALGVADGGPPRIEGVEPPVGSALGGSRITLRGKGLEGFTRASIGGRDIEGARLVAGGSIQGTAPCAARAGAASVEVATPAGSSALAEGYRYLRHLTRGDVNGDLKLNVTDVALVVRLALSLQEARVCAAVGDFTGDSKVDLQDAVFLMEYLFARGRDPDDFFVDCE